MNLRDGENLQFTKTRAFVDDLNTEFYGKYPYPWPPMKFRVNQDPDFETVMLNQNLGDWDHRTVPASPKIWVAGCGTNQAAMTAIKFPRARVIGSDISRTSLEICANSAKQLNVANLELRRESLNEVSYEDEFDYVISTGVIHHNAKPQAVLRNIVRAMKPQAILELMVYNKACWTLPANFQRSIRLLCRHDERPELDAEMALAQGIVNAFSIKNSLGDYLSQFKNCPESMFADALLQPVLHSYTVESLGAMARECQLELLQPHVSIFDKSAKTVTWNMRFASPSAQERYDALPDLERWKISNLLLWEQSPMLLWFYFQRRDSNRPRKSEADICGEFLRRKFVRAQTTAQAFVQRENNYVLSDRQEIYPAFDADPTVRNLLEAADGTQTMKQIMRTCDVGLDFATVNTARIRLTTSEFPFLRSVG